MSDQNDQESGSKPVATPQHAKKSVLVRMLVKLSIIVTVPLVLLGLYWLFESGQINVEVFVGVGGGTAAAGLALALLNYLDDNSRSVLLSLLRAVATSVPILGHVDSQLRRSNFLDEREDLLARLSLLQQTRSQLASAKPLSLEDKASIVAQVAADIRGDVNASVLTKLEEKFGDAVAKSRRLDELRSLADRTKVRLLDEVGALSKRSNLNLVIGILTTLAAVILLSYVVITAPREISDWRTLLPGYFLRLSLVVFIEVFAFFFLRMYRVSLQDIKYFQNELTSVEARFIALEAAIGLNDTEATRSIVAQLATLDRNLPLQQGQSTIELERLRIENGNLKSFLQALGKFSPVSSKEDSK